MPALRQRLANALRRKAGRDLALPTGHDAAIASSPMLAAASKPCAAGSSPSRPLPLENGEFMHASEFLRGYERMPQVKKAELIEGVFYMGSSVSVRHAKPDGIIQVWLGTRLNSAVFVMARISTGSRSHLPSSWPPNNPMRPGCKLPTWSPAPSALRPCGQTRPTEPMRSLELSSKGALRETFAIGDSKPSPENAKSLQHSPEAQRRPDVSSPTWRQHAPIQLNR